MKLIEGIELLPYVDERKTKITSETTVVKFLRYIKAVFLTIVRLPPQPVYIMWTSHRQASRTALAQVDRVLNKLNDSRMFSSAIILPRGSFNTRNIVR